MKADSTCRGCEEKVHWFRDREGCAAKVQMKDESRKKDFMDIERPPNRHMDNKNVGTFFRSGGK